jgi:GDP-4-dehydro-6-deoxy-D-mannose reductase
MLLGGKRVLVVGADGFAGRHLQVELRCEGAEVIALAGPSHGELGLDVRDAEAVQRALERSRPDAVVNLSALSSRAESDANPSLTFAVNALGSVHILAATQRVAPRARVLLISSGEVYGSLPPGQLAEEAMAPCPANPYAAAKLCAEIAGQQFHRSYGLEVLSARPFNHLGPGQSDRFVVPALAKQIAKIKKGEGEPVLRMGDLSPQRDFSHVRDVARAYVRLLVSGEPGQAYNVASGELRSIRSVLDEMLELAGVTARIEVDAPKFRPLEIRARAGNSARLRALGWSPREDVRTALREALADQGVIASA